jgi:hypothetical protein
MSPLRWHPAPRVRCRWAITTCADSGRLRPIHPDATQQNTHGPTDFCASVGAAPEGELTRRDPISRWIKSPLLYQLSYRVAQSVSAKITADSRESRPRDARQRKTARTGQLGARSLDLSRDLPTLRWASPANGGSHPRYSGGPHTPSRGAARRYAAAGRRRILLRPFAVQGHDLQYTLAPQS